jgi:hypothetical protein
MGLSAKAWVKLLKQRIVAVSAHLGSLATPGNPQDALNRASAYGLAFGDLELLIKILWRHALGDPGPFVAQALDRADAAARLATEFPNDYGGYNFFPFTTSLFFGLLVRGKLLPDLFAQLPPLSAAGEPEYPYFNVLPDTYLLHALQSGKKPRGWDQLLQKRLPKHAQTDLTAVTLACYMDIICQTRAKEFDAAIESVIKACENYDRRAADEWRDFGNVDGSSTFNKLMVDHRLAAIVKTCFKKKEKLLEPLKIVHLWRW